MAKTNMIERDKRRTQTVKKYAALRARLKETIRTPKSSPEERSAAQAKLQALPRYTPRDASPSRQRKRCAITGRSRGVYRKFGLGRTKIREVAARGEIPGLAKASW
jgi:small subunit ribosomal protein S14